MKTILITGGSGFIGSHLCKRLLDEENIVLCLDNLFTGEKDNIKYMLNHPLFEFIRHDIIDPVSLEADEIYNLACPASPVYYQFDPIQTVKANTQGVINMLELAKRTKATILQASTSEVYGDPEVSPQPETYLGRVNTIGPRSCYDEGKRCAETLFTDYWRKANVGIRIARIFNTYGPNMQPDDGRVVSNFIMQALQGSPLTVYGTGLQTRSFCYVSDMVEGLIRLQGSLCLTPVNLGNPDERTIQEIAEIILRLTGSKSKIEYKHLPIDDPQKRQPDISRAKEFLDWGPKVELEEGLEKTIYYFNKKYF